MNRAQSNSALDATLGTADRETRRSDWAFSPIELLAHITLPLVLILAIAAQLIAMTHAMAIRDLGSTLDGLQKDGAWQKIIAVWKENFIRRIDRVCHETEQEWRLGLFVDATRDKRGELRRRPNLKRVHWKEGWPGDDDLQHLCACAGRLLEAERLTRELYQKVLTYRPPGGSPAEWPRLYDPKVFPNATAPRELQEFVKVTEEQRDFAWEQIWQRCLRWRELIAMLQLDLVSEVEREHFRPQATGNLDADLARAVTDSMKQLQNRGYPLLPEATGARR